STDALNLGSIEALPHRLCRNTQETTDRDFDRCTPSRSDITFCLKVAHCSQCAGRLEGPLSVDLLSGTPLRRASGNGALQPVADDAAYGRRCPTARHYAAPAGIGSVGW